jgi:hypothetical protein
VTSRVTIPVVIGRSNVAEVVQFVGGVVGMDVYRGCDGVGGGKGGRYRRCGIGWERNSTVKLIGGILDAPEPVLMVSVVTWRNMTGR